MSSRTLGNGSSAAGFYDETYGSHAHRYAQATCTASAQTLVQMGVTIPTWATLVFVVPTNAVRYRCDGLAPTDTAGMPIVAGQWAAIQGEASLAGLQIVGAATLDLEFRG